MPLLVQLSARFLESLRGEFEKKKPEVLQFAPEVHDRDLETILSFGGVSAYHVSHGISAWENWENMQNM